MAKKLLSGKDNTNGFQKNPQNINKTGANRKTIAKVNIELQDKGYPEATKNDIISCYLRLIQVEIPQLTKLIESKEQPALIRIVGKAILSGKGFDVIERVLDRGIGKATNSLDVKVEEVLDTSSMTTEELIKRAAALRKIKGKE